MRKTDSFSDLCNLEVRMFYNIIYRVIEIPVDGQKTEMHVNLATSVIPSLRNDEIGWHSIRQCSNAVY